MRILLSLFILALILASCRKDIDLKEGQRFMHALVPDQQACTQVQSGGPMFNCFQVLEFTGRNTLTIVVTDIQNRGQYKIRGNKLIIHSEDHYDVPEKMEFEIVDNNTLEYKGSIWKRWKGPGAWDFY